MPSGSREKSVVVIVGLELLAAAAAAVEEFSPMLTNSSLFFPTALTIEVLVSILGQASMESTWKRKQQAKQS